MDKKPTEYVLIPVDFSAYSEVALLHACRLAKCFNAKPLVLHVVHDPGEVSGYYSMTMKKKHLHRIEDSATEMLNDFLHRTAKANRLLSEIHKAESLLIRGLPENRILEVADKYNVTMIVMGSRGRTGLKNLMLGSVAERVMKLANVPVTVVKTLKPAK